MKEHWDNRYQEYEFVYGYEPNEFIQQISRKINFSGHSLAIAEGEGRNALFLANKAKEENRTFSIELWDYSIVGLEKAQSRAIKENLTITTQCLDLDDVSWQESQFENIFCVFGHFPLKLKEKTLKGIRGALKHNGWFVGEVYSTEQLKYATGGPRHIDMLYELQDFLNNFGKDFIYHIFMGEVERHEGALHTGKCHVIQFAIQIKKNKD